MKENIDISFDERQQLSASFIAICHSTIRRGTLGYNSVLMLFDAKHEYEMMHAIAYVYLTMTKYSQQAPAGRGVYTCRHAAHYWDDVNQAPWLYYAAKVDITRLTLKVINDIMLILKMREAEHRY